jgi:hypothetical protein
MSVSCACFMLSDTDLGDEPITRPEKSYRRWCQCVWSRNVKNEAALAHFGLLPQMGEAGDPFHNLRFLNGS